MARKPRIGITLRVVTAETHQEKRDALSHDWPRLVNDINGHLYLIPNALSDVREFLASIDLSGLIFSGGDNFGDDRDRDRTESQMLEYGIAQKLPILGVCRGMQVLNKLLGGTIQVNRGIHHVNTSHSIDIVDDTFAACLARQLVVNSYHENIIRSPDLATDLKTFATCSDGTIEGFYHRLLPIVGVMWHPERQPSRESALLLREIFDTQRFWTQR